MSAPTADGGGGGGASVSCSMNEEGGGGGKAFVLASCSAGSRCAPTAGGGGGGGSSSCSLNEGGGGGGSAFVGTNESPFGGLGGRGAVLNGAIEGRRSLTFCLVGAASFILSASPALVVVGGGGVCGGVGGGVGGEAVGGSVGA